VILMTDAPYSPRMRVIVGPAMMRHNSRTLMPLRSLWSDDLGNGTGGVLVSRLVTVQGGNLLFVRPFVLC
jgi:hypothetical protein